MAVHGKPTRSQQEEGPGCSVTGSLLKGRDGADCRMCGPAQLLPLEHSSAGLAQSKKSSKNGQSGYLCPSWSLESWSLRTGGSFPISPSLTPRMKNAHAKESEGGWLTGYAWPAVILALPLAPPPQSLREASGG